MTSRCVRVKLISPARKRDVVFDQYLTWSSAGIGSWGILGVPRASGWCYRLQYSSPAGIAGREHSTLSNITNLRSSSTWSTIEPSQEAYSKLHLIYPQNGWWRPGKFPKFAMFLLSYKLTMGNE